MKLQKINVLINKGELIGREKLTQETKGTKYEMTKYQMRSRLDKLERLGLIIMKQGKYETVLSDKWKEI